MHAPASCGLCAALAPLPPSPGAATLCPDCEEHRDAAETHRAAFCAGLERATWPFPSQQDEADRAASLAAYDAECRPVLCCECCDEIALPPDAYPICSGCLSLYTL